MLRTSKVIRSRNTLCVIRIKYKHMQPRANNDTRRLDEIEMYFAPDFDVKIKLETFYLLHKVYRSEWLRYVEILINQVRYQY